MRQLVREQGEEHGESGAQQRALEEQAMSEVVGCALPILITCPELLALSDGDGNQTLGTAALRGRGGRAATPWRGA